MDRTEEVTYVTWHAIAFANAFWASMLLVASSIFGHAAVYVCDQGRQQIIELAHIRTGSMDVEDLLQQLPESISKTIHQTTSPHGTVFQSFMLVAALLMLVSEFPKHEYVQLGLDLQLVGLEACRYLFPVIGIILLVFVPMSHDYILMIERFKQPGYQLTLEDKAVFFANKLQEDMHQAAGTLVFAATPGLEGYAVGRAYVEFFGNSMGEDYISWNDGNAATYMWLALLFGRTIMLLGTHACLWNMVYEMYCEPTARFSRNPYYVYDVEKALIRHLLNYVMLMGMSIWFVNETQFNLLSSLAQTVLLSLAALALVLTACYTLNVLRYLACKERYLNNATLSKQFNKLFTKTEKRMDKYTEELEELHEKWAKCTVKRDVSDEDDSDDDLLCDPGCQ
ncbi:unnamed protein product [Effrenium voratum]|uniref:Uncharacterized protein n=1 Tax=Effrenium voratum TaxID=2562239 RepID=A0AA36JPY4_9DINO|nr:unnamed protein product [Effrenium voratum]CAJ1410267.1 unnamed protein product [Effrenium voratum]CAJ1443412.1 unnamed protein product [Effrenium voratum]